MKASFWVKVSFLLFWIVNTSIRAAPKPNILWITSEDNAAHWLGCYGNAEAKTPHLDQFAAKGIQYDRFYSNAPVCAVARSTILFGAYAPTLGSQHMRSRQAIPERYRSHVSYLREHGYYCSNRSKTDYNVKGEDKSHWDDCSKTAHYKNRSDLEQPFFAIFNLDASHESSLFEAKISSQRRKSLLPETPRLDPKSLMVPPHLPDLPEIRNEIAIYHDVITLLDQQVGDILTELEASGVAENTIVFYYADHGGVTPRGKRYLKDTGVRVPLLIHFPKKWQHLSPYQAGTVVQDPVAFVDLLPSLLACLDLEVPESLPGRSLFQKSSVERNVFLYADRFDEFYGMRRGLVDGRWKYIRRFSPRLAAAPYSSYQFGQAGWTAWKTAWEKGFLSEQQTKIWEKDQLVEELFDTHSDPWEIKNLAHDSLYAEKLATMRSKLKARMAESVDCGLIPEPLYSVLSAEGSIAEYADSRRKDWPSLIEKAFLATRRDAKNLAQFQSDLTSEDVLVRYWAAVGCLVLGEKAVLAQEQLLKALDDDFSVIRSTVALAISTFDEEKGVTALLSELGQVEADYDCLFLLNAFHLSESQHLIPESWLKDFAREGKVGDYCQRWVNEFLGQRAP